MVLHVFHVAPTGDMLHFQLVEGRQVVHQAFRCITCCQDSSRLLPALANIIGSEIFVILIF